MVNCPMAGQLNLIQSKPMDFLLPVLAAVMFGGSSIVTAVVWLVIIAIIWMVVDYFKVPDPINKMIKVILVIGAVWILISFLLGITGTRLP